jgi:uncharacterized protein with NRDE domain
VLKLGNSKEEDKKKKKKKLRINQCFSKSHESSKPKWKIGVVKYNKGWDCFVMFYTSRQHLEFNNKLLNLKLSNQNSFFLKTFISILACMLPIIEVIKNKKAVDLHSRKKC